MWIYGLLPEDLRSELARVRDEVISAWTIADPSMDRGVPMHLTNLYTLSVWLVRRVHQLRRYQ